MVTSRFFLACSLALTTMSAPAAAQTVDKRTLFTFSGPVAMPGVTLPAGTYLFRLADPTSGRHVVQVLSEDGKKAYGMFFSMRTDRRDAAATPEVRFMETASGMPVAVRTWWYPGERSGYEFIYPKEQARRLVRGATEPVLTTQAQTTTTEQTNTADLTRLSSGGQEMNVNADATAASTAQTGTTQQGQVASSNLSIANATIPARPVPPSAEIARPAEAPTSSASAATSRSRTRTSLPQTASSVQAVGLMGLLTLSSGALLSIRRRR